ncbi:hypothetical protein A7D21_01065 [Pseudomonas sp. AP19]|uniref:hypothetical protein n=1 Tax=Pseudomonas TaxID=286 RepID=UPI00084A3315|nr:hypothetical protein [Pseudomonas sp. AP19]OEC68482.1 hypothetical protein A7D21_01065 [Pseudomonas sp. AP19]
MFRVFVFLAVVIFPAAYVFADGASPWEQGQDLEQFYTQYCSAPNLEKHYFPSLDTQQLATLTKLTSEVLWADLSEDLVGHEGSSTQVFGRLRTLGHPIAPAFTSMLQQAAKEPMRTKYVYAYNTNADQRSYVVDTFEKLGKSDAKFGAAMLTVLECRIIRNVKSMDPFVASRVAQVKAIKLPKVSTSSAKASSNGGYSEPDCSCGGGNFCYGPRGGHYCITSGGKKAYVKH